MISSCRRPPTPWSEGIVGSARCRSQCTGFEHRPTWRVAWLWTCNGSDKPPVGNPPRRACIKTGRARDDSPSLLQTLNTKIFDAILEMIIDMEGSRKVLDR